MVPLTNRGAPCQSGDAVIHRSCESPLPAGEVGCRRVLTQIGARWIMESLPSLGELTGAIQEVRRRLDTVRAAISELPQDKRGEATAAVLSATQTLGDLYSDFAADMLRVLGSGGSA
jgi:hypothetical protein